jgi:hypothetical protein
MIKNTTQTKYQERLEEFKSLPKEIQLFELLHKRDYSNALGELVTGKFSPIVDVKFKKSYIDLVYQEFRLILILSQDYLKQIDNLDSLENLYFVSLCEADLNWTKQQDVFIHFIHSQSIVSKTLQSGKFKPSELSVIFAELSNDTKQNV